MQAGKKKRSVGETLMNQSVCYTCACPPHFNSIRHTCCLLNVTAHWILLHSSFAISSPIQWSLLLLSLLVPIPFLQLLWNAVWRMVLVIILEVARLAKSMCLCLACLILLQPSYDFDVLPLLLLLFTLNTATSYNSWKTESRWFSWFRETIENRIDGRKV